MHTCININVSTLFIRIFKFISIPIISVSLIATLASISRSSESGKIFRHTIFYTLFTTILAASIAALLYGFFAPETISMSGAAAPEGVVERSYLDYIKSIVPDNILGPFLSGNVLSVLLVSTLVGLAIAKLPVQSESRTTILNFFKGAQDVLFVIVGWIITILPIGIFGFISQLVVEMKSGENLHQDVLSSSLFYKEFFFTQ